MKYVITLLCALAISVHFNFTESPAAHNEDVQSKPVVLSTVMGEEHTFEQQFQAQVEHWINTLASDPDFISWSQAKWEKFPLGPGMHGWVVLITSATSHEEIGYLIVSIALDGKLQLAEYGLGDYPLFSLASLNRTISQHELVHHPDEIERLYLNAFQAVWKVQENKHVTYFDGVTGQNYDLNEDIVKQSIELTPHGQFLNTPLQLLEQKRFSLFDPYELLNWLIDDPLDVATFQDLTLALAQPPHKITYTASIFANSIRVPLAVVGYHLWDKGEPYIVVDQHSLRFIPFSALLQQGVFYIQ